MRRDVQPSLRGAKRTVLVVVEEPAIRELLAVNLRHAGLIPVEAASSLQGRRLVGEVRPDMVLIDLDCAGTADRAFASGLKLPDDEGDVPTVMLTSRIQQMCGASGEVCGATLCVSKPYAPRDLVGRIVRQLRSKRGGAAKEGKTLRVGPLELDRDRQAATMRRAGRTEGVALSPVELKVLNCLMEGADRVLRREEIVAAAWGAETLVDDRTVDQYVRRLRQALSAVGASDMVQTVRGLGYRINAMPIRHLRHRS